MQAARSTDSRCNGRPASKAREYIGDSELVPPAAPAMQALAPRRDIVRFARVSRIRCAGPCARLRNSAMPSITVKFFGPARSIAGQDSVRMDIAAGETVGQLAGRLAERYPRLGEALGVRLAVNRTYVALNCSLSEGDEVAVIPPVSGGAPVPTVALMREPIDVPALVASLEQHAAGAVATFVGTVRLETDADKALTALDYEAYEEMALAQMKDIRSKALSQFSILDAAIVHRLGRLGLGEASIAVVVVSAHRTDAFEACRWIVDHVKVDVPIWKKDVWSDGSETWVDPLA